MVTGPINFLSHDYTQARKLKDIHFTTFKREGKDIVYMIVSGDDFTEYEVNIDIDTFCDIKNLFEQVSDKIRSNK